MPTRTGTSQYTTDFQGLYLAVEQLDDNFLEEHDLPDGNLYKMENGTGVGGIGGESNNQGDYPQPDDSSDLIAFKTTYEAATAETADWWKQNFNLDSYYNYRSILEAIHHYDIAAGKNYFYYHNPETNKWETLPWDIDLTWANNMFGSGNEPFRSRVLAIPEFALGYRNRMREIRDLLYNSEQVGLADRRDGIVRLHARAAVAGRRRPGHVGLQPDPGVELCESRQGGARPVLRRRRRVSRPPAAMPA